MSLENIQDDSRHGGARKGAGRKAGSATSKTREIADKAAACGITPLEYMLKLMRTDEVETEDMRDLLAQRAMRFEAAKAAAPYIHPRLAAIEHTGENGGPISIQNRIELVAMSANSTD